MQWLKWDLVVGITQKYGVAVQYEEMNQLVISHMLASQDLFSFCARYD